MATDHNIAVFARTHHRYRPALFGIRQRDRRSHMYVIGKTGAGKTTLLETLIVQDIAAGRGLVLLDPHGDLVERVLLQVPAERYPDLLYFNVPDAANPVSFNPLEHVPPEKRSLAASGMLAAFKKHWSDSWGPRLEYILRNALLTLVQQPEATIADILRLFEDEDYRKQALSYVDNERIRSFWFNEFDKYSKSFRQEAIAPIQNKVGPFLADPILQAILSQPKSSFDIREVMDSGKVLLVNLAKGRIGEDSAGLLGSLLVSRLELAALSRADIPEDARRDFYVYLDEFHSFATMSLATMLAELRKYRVNLILAHQYLTQLEPDIKDAVLGNVGTTIAFRLGPEDARVFAREFAPIFEAEDLLRLPNYSIVLKLMIEGAPSRPFTAETITITDAA
jgi:DNA helicase HerA-like ATPase